MKEMKSSKRITINVMATYGRSLLHLLLGLFSSRWVVMSLGEEDYGLYGLVGGLVMFVALINNVLSSAVGRFYAVAIGESQKSGNSVDGIENCRRWFNVAIVVHSMIPLLLIIIGYPLGRLFILSFLNIPSGRLCACIDVWGYTCISCFFSMCIVPYVAMYTAKQNIAEMTIFSMANIFANFVLAYYMVSHPMQNWLVRYAAGVCIIHIICSFLLCVRANAIYVECKVNKKYMFDVKRLGQIVRFAGYRMFAETSNVFSSQGIAIAANKFWGARGNAAMTVGRSVASHASTLCSALGGAFWPAIANLSGMGEKSKMREYSYRVCRIGSLLFLLFAIPVALESDELMILWLKTPPLTSGILCIAFLIGVFLDQLSCGLWMSIYAVGDIKMYQIITSVSSWLGLLFGVLAFWFGFRVLSVFCFCVVQGICCVCVRLIFSKKIAMISIRRWCICVLLPIVSMLLLCIIFGMIPRLLLKASLIRVIITVIATTTAFIPCAWFMVFDASEKEFMLSILRRKLLNK